MGRLTDFQQIIIAIIYALPGRKVNMTIGELAAELMTSKPQMKRSVKALAKRKIVKTAGRNETTRVALTARTIRIMDTW